jgi:hypothetical protein
MPSYTCGRRSHRFARAAQAVDSSKRPKKNGGSKRTDMVRRSIALQRVRGLP